MNTADRRTAVPGLLASLESHCQYLLRSGLRHIPRPATVIRRQASAGGKPALLQRLRQEIGDCQRCKLCLHRTNIVFGEGNPDARLAFVGEAPGADEDIQGRPFVGNAGQLLTRIIEAIQLKRADVYIANIVKCRPPSNRDPEDDEIRTCLPFVQQQMAIIKPRIICTLGRIATRALLQTDRGITELRGKFHQLGDCNVMPTYHPSYLLRNQEKKRETWADMQMVQAELKREG
jgi:DNA polymerase